MGLAALAAVRFFAVLGTAAAAGTLGGFVVDRVFALRSSEAGFGFDRHGLDAVGEDFAAGQLDGGEDAVDGGADWDGEGGQGSGDVVGEGSAGEDRGFERLDRTEFSCDGGGVGDVDGAEEFAAFHGVVEVGAAAGGCEGEEREAASAASCSRSRRKANMLIRLEQRQRSRGRTA